VSERVTVVSLIEHLKHMHHIILLSLSRLSLPYFYNYLIKRTILRKSLKNI